LSLAPTPDPLCHLSFITVLAGVIKLGADHVIGQVLLRRPMLRVAVRIVIAGAMPKALSIPAGVHEVQWHGSSAFGFDFFSSSKIGTCGVGLGRGGKVKRRFYDGVNTFGHADVFKRLGSSVGYHQALRVS